ncbi:MAG: hypothetical protein A3K06_03055 [Candidatus Doudnabacteria bacterium RIFCSPHIGHO2_01_52_17]|uniref:RNA polymerase subunit sigma-24 n=1 Tax=Candidatus Doudnabacteria bacterium RIFCSPHIGHO2_01_52_17 TaxID=1817820 RepID=A0A1F5NAD0_9BACT|nr:MAG: hypothetical protein A3K06_03055 [Candidatus Doudnabacteria bacterium RIFCSPHIGHO2_01_52_17]
MKQISLSSVFIIGPSKVAESSNKNQVEELVRKAMRGDETAFGQLYDLYFEKVYRFVFYRVNHREAAEDLVSEIFIRIWDKIPGIQGPGAFNGWIFQIARNLVIDYYRAKKITVNLDDLENVLQYEDNILERTNFDFDQRAFMEALPKLGADQQIVIKLKFIDELDNEEIAALLKKSEGAIRVIQHRALTELKKLLNQDE